MGNEVTYVGAARCRPYELSIFCGSVAQFWMLLFVKFCDPCARMWTIRPCRVASNDDVIFFVGCDAMCGFVIHRFKLVTPHFASIGFELYNPCVGICSPFGERITDNVDMIRTIDCDTPRIIIAI